MFRFGLRLIAILVALSAPALAHAAKPAPPIRIGVIKIMNDVPLYTAMKLKFFQEAGLNVRFVPVRSGVEGQAAVVGRSLEFIGTNSVSFLFSRAQGLPLLAVVDGGRATMKAPAAYAAVVRSDGSVPTPKSLEGKTVGLISRKSLQELHFIQWARQANFDPSKVRFIEIAHTQMQDALVSRQIDAALMLEPYITRALSDKRVKLLSYFSIQAEPGHAATLWLGNTAWIKSHPDETRRFARAMYRAHDYLNKHPAEAKQLIAEFTGLPPALVDKAAVDVLPLSLNPDSLQRQAAAMQALRWVSKPIDVKSGIWTGQ